MKFKSLSIREIRGIRQFDRDIGQNLVICGDNGTGKSGVIDAIDFLLSGRMRRLSGDGSRDLSLDEHGRHVGSVLESAYIEAEVLVSATETIKIRRTIKSKRLEESGGSAMASALLADELKSGQFALTRKELLRFIACEGSTRAEQVQALLDLRDAEKVRAAIGQSVSQLERKEAELAAVGKAAELQIDNILGLRNGAWNERLGKINELRRALGAEEIQNLTDDLNLTRGVSRTVKPNGVTRGDFDKLLSGAQNSLHDRVASSTDTIKLLEELQKRPKLKEELRATTLIEMGLKTVVGDFCPLCDKEWRLDELKRHLSEKARRAEESRVLKDRYDRVIASIKEGVNSQSSALKRLQDALAVAGQDSLATQVNDSVARLKANTELFENLEFASCIELLKEKSYVIDLSKEQWTINFETFVDSLPVADSTDAAYGSLVSLKQPYQTFVDNRVVLRKVRQRLDVVKLIKDKFDRAQLSFMEALYSDIERDFSEFYSAVNPEDEGEFPVKLKPDGAALDLKVGFYGTGMHPPHALHSEGHQDIMGVCLYLALMKQLKKEKFTFCMLDDVMMSIDADHRRKLCNLLRNRFQETQFVITTHDRLWAEQLREVGLVAKKELLFFRSWSLEHGPIFDNKDVWESLFDKIEKKETLEAATGLRRICEQEFSEIASNLGAQIVYKGSQAWTLGDFRPAAYSKFKRLLEEAKGAAKTWGATENEKKLEAALGRLKEAEEDARINWQTNKAIHFTRWGDLTAGEIKVTIQAMSDLLSTFRCPDCAGLIIVAIPADKYDPTSLNCNCGKFNFTLVSKS